MVSLHWRISRRWKLVLVMRRALASGVGRPLAHSEMLEGQRPAVNHEAPACRAATGLPKQRGGEEGRGKRHIVHYGRNGRCAFFPSGLRPVPPHPFRYPANRPLWLLLRPLQDHGYGTCFVEGFWPRLVGTVERDLEFISLQLIDGAERLTLFAFGTFGRHQVKLLGRLRRVKGIVAFTAGDDLVPLEDDRLALDL